LKKPQALIGLLAALGTAIGVLVAVIGLPYGRADYTAFAELYHGTENTAGFYHLAIDCDTSTAATDTSCVVPLTGSPQQVQVDVTLGNSTAGSSLVAAFNWTVVNPDNTRLVAPQPACSAPKLNCNPDFLDSTESTEGQTGANWSCDPVLADQAISPAVDWSIVSCINPVDAYTSSPGPGHIDQGRVTYDVLITALPGSVALVLQDVNVADESGTEIASCNPEVTQPGKCYGATLNFLEPTPTPIPPTDTPTNTATATFTPTNTPENTPTFTPTATFTPIPDPGFQKVAETSGNLWLCNDTDGAGPICSGAGEGSLHVEEQALNVFTGDTDGDTIPDGLGAYEFSVEYDNFVIASVNPCDVVFGPGGEGAARGPVDELDSSSENADCSDDPNPPPANPNNGLCSMSIVTENVVRFGCVTGGQVEGPSSTFVGDAINVASLELIPNEDLSNDIFPGNNNGVLTVIKDGNCELVDIFGHPTIGSVDGGLTPLCGDLAVTVRILEGDLNLDCTVDVDDAQEIAKSYGGFFGSLLYSKWLDLEPQTHDLDIDIKDIQKVFGRLGSTCQTPIPAQDPLPPPTGFGD
jgi:hypothetical protein